MDRGLWPKMCLKAQAWKVNGMGPETLHMNKLEIITKNYRRQSVFFISVMMSDVS